MFPLSKPQPCPSLDKASTSISNKQGCGPVRKEYGNAVLDTEIKKRKAQLQTAQVKAKRIGKRGGKEVNLG